MYQVKYIVGHLIDLMGNVMESDSIVRGTQTDVQKAPANMLCFCRCILSFCFSRNLCFPVLSLSN